MTEYDVIFSIFDPKTGPIVLYTSLDSIDIANKTAMKSFIAIGAMEDSLDFESKYAVLPLPSYRKIAFYYMFRIKSGETGENLFATIANMLDSDSTIDFYRTLSSLQQKVTSTVEFIQNSFMYKGKDSVLDKTIPTCKVQSCDITKTIRLKYSRFRSNGRICPFFIVNPIFRPSVIRPLCPCHGDIIKKHLLRAYANPLLSFVYSVFV